MSKPGPATPVKPVVSMLLARQDLAPALVERLAGYLGPPDLVGPWWPFDATDYYTPEMGPDLGRRLVSFLHLADPARLANWKVFTNALKQALSLGERRLANLDPGYVAKERLVLATGKNFSHRIYLDHGIYGDLTLVFGQGGWQTLPWSYPDYARGPLPALLDGGAPEISLATQGDGNMIKSMTAYGRGEVETAAQKWVVELKSLNHRFLELVLNLPRRLWASGGPPPEAHQEPDGPGPGGDAAHLGELRRESPDPEGGSGRGGRGPGRAGAAAAGRQHSRVPEAGASPALLGPVHHQGRNQELELEATWEAVSQAVTRALDVLDQMRLTEGAALAADLALSLSDIRREMAASSIWRRCCRSSGGRRSRLAWRSW